MRRWLRLDRCLWLPIPDPRAPAIAIPQPHHQPSYIAAALEPGRHPEPWFLPGGTPKGVSLHRIDAGLDTGDLLGQRRLWFGPAETLASSYERLRREVESFFAESWPSLIDGRLPAKPQEGEGSIHSAAEKRDILP